MKHIIPALAILALPLAAQETQLPQPGFIQLNFEMPVQGLKDQVDHRMGLGGSLGYVFYGSGKANHPNLTLAVKLDTDEFSNGSTHREAHGVGIGGEFTVYFQSGFRGAYLSAAPSLCVWSLTDRDQGSLANRHYVRGGGTIALGYRFARDYSLEAHWKSVTLDQDLQLSSFGLGLKLHF